MGRRGWQLARGCGRWRPSLLAVLLPLMALGWATVPPTLRLPSVLSATGVWIHGPVATVAEVEQRLAQDPTDWSGRIVLVRAGAARDVVWQTPDSLVTQLALVDPGRPPERRHLP